ncbi:hypothetical protein H9P43_004790 [Blastocladiella emersonii ATCC 22665]|nr:hypothetical protein H9P43_004789 [Blastocladiella emersonii ATCC 22665]KAI9179466.1 hypothetical protein H9P43_004790 [Blastocladiella emersonii ATCC 22665]
MEASSGGGGVVVAARDGGPAAPTPAPPDLAATTATSSSSSSLSSSSPAPMDEDVSTTSPSASTTNATAAAAAGAQPNATLHGALSPSPPSPAEGFYNEEYPPAAHQLVHAQGPFPASEHYTLAFRVADVRPAGTPAKELCQPSLTVKELITDKLSHMGLRKGIRSVRTVHWTDGNYVHARFRKLASAQWVMRGGLPIGPGTKCTTTGGRVGEDLVPRDATENRVSHMYAKVIVSNVPDAWSGELLMSLLVQYAIGSETRAALLSLDKPDPSRTRTASLLLPRHDALSLIHNVRCSVINNCAISFDATVVQKDRRGYTVPNSLWLHGLPAGTTEGVLYDYFESMGVKLHGVRVRRALRSGEERLTRTACVRMPLPKDVQDGLRMGVLPMKGTSVFLRKDGERCCHCCGSDAHWSTSCDAENPANPVRRSTRKPKPLPPSSRPSNASNTSTSSRKRQRDSMVVTPLATVLPAGRASPGLSWSKVVTSSSPAPTPAPARAASAAVSLASSLAKATLPMTLNLAAAAARKEGPLAAFGRRYGCLPDGPASAEAKALFQTLACQVGAVLAEAAAASKLASTIINLATAERAAAKAIAQRTAAHAAAKDAIDAVRAAAAATAAAAEGADGAESMEGVVRDRARAAEAAAQEAEAHARVQVANAAAAEAAARQAAAEAKTEALHAAAARSRAERAKSEAEALAATNHKLAKEEKAAELTLRKGKRRAGAADARAAASAAADAAATIKAQKARVTKLVDQIDLANERAAGAASASEEFGRNIRRMFNALAAGVEDGRISIAPEVEQEFKDIQANVATVFHNVLIHGYGPLGDEDLMDNDNDYVPSDSDSSDAEDDYDSDAPMDDYQALGAQLDCADCGGQFDGQACTLANMCSARAATHAKLAKKIAAGAAAEAAMLKAKTKKLEDMGFGKMDRTFMINAIYGPSSPSPLASAQRAASSPSSSSLLAWLSEPSSSRTPAYLLAAVKLSTPSPLPASTYARAGPPPPAPYLSLLPPAAAAHAAAAGLPAVVHLATSPAAPAPAHPPTTPNRQDGVGSATVTVGTQSAKAL